MNRSILIIAGSLLVGTVPVSPAPQLSPVEAAPKCIDKTPACLKEIQFVDVKAGCEFIVPGTELIQGSSYQLRGRIEKDRTVNISGLPGTDGWIFATVNTDADLVTQAGEVWGTFLKMFDNLSATVYGTYVGTLENGQFFGHATGRATGEFDGYLFEADMQPLPVDEFPGGDPCPGGSLTGNGLRIESTFRIDPLATADEEK
jgi:hypothetical protein